MNLLDSQKQAFEKLNKLKVGALFMQQGTGKTRAAMELVKSTDSKLVVWIAPLQTRENLLSEIDKQGGLDSLVFYGIESISQSDRVYLELYSLLENAFNDGLKPFIVCDESIKIKNMTAKRTRRMLDLAAMSEYRLVLNGSPIVRDLLDIYSQFEFLSHKILGMSLSQFKDTFCEYTRIRKRHGKKVMQKEFITSYHNIEYLYSLLSNYVYECDLRLVISKNHIDLSYDLCDETMESYKLLKAKYLDSEQIAAMNNNIFLEITQKMQHSYCTTENKFVVLDSFLKCKDCSKVIIYAKYVQSREILERKYSKLGCKILSYGMHSYGLNLQDRNITIYFDKTFDYDKRIQSDGRTYRIGQQSDCLYVDLTGNVPLESLINSNIDKKRSMADYFRTASINEIKESL